MMNKSKKIKILLTSFSALAATTVVATTIASCSKNVDKHDNTPQPTNGIFTSKNLFEPVAHSIPKQIKKNQSWTLSTKINITNIVDHSILPNAEQIASADLSGIVKVNSIPRSFNASSIYHNDTKVYDILNLTIQPPIKKLTTTNNLFTNANLQAPVKLFVNKFFISQKAYYGKTIIINPVFREHRDSKIILAKDSHTIIGYSKVVTLLLTIDNKEHNYAIRVTYSIANQAHYRISW